MNEKTEKHMQINNNNFNKSVLYFIFSPYFSYLLLFLSFLLNFLRFDCLLFAL